MYKDVLYADFAGVKIGENKIFIRVKLSKYFEQRVNK